MYKFLTTLENQIRVMKENMDITKIEQVIEALQNAKSVFVLGAGRSGFVAKSFAMRLMHCGFNVYVVGEKKVLMLASRALRRGVLGDAAVAPAAGTAAEKLPFLSLLRARTCCALRGGTPEGGGGGCVSGLPERRGSTRSVASMYALMSWFSIQGA